MELRTKRTWSNEKQTISTFEVFDEWNCSVMSGYIMELPDRENATGISRIKAGQYDVVKRRSPKYKNHFHVLDVEGRKWILIHFGNYHTDTRGCLLPGSDLYDINGDGLMDVTYSKDTMDELNDVLPDKFILIIEDED